ncbi:PEP-CTERM sorting domain-containing protein [Methylomonas albis]|uniref:PEP-CTERM sorting domain-containing protein n=1 Tax=Methylomonas albis TaxID=1854563 RepID=A0ABR9CXI1_9GAMM|nr:PEP-CTERM sorting domain-containing protein [Methylomonas albis]MBD9355591.1 PEP-CTERM sorting domain-containing protein [Methylomonas albis]
MIKTKLAKAISLAVAGMALSATASATVTTMYNATTGVDGSVAAGTTNPNAYQSVDANNNPITIRDPSYLGQTDGWSNGAGEQTLGGATTPAVSGWTNPTTGVTYAAGARVPVGYYATQNWVGTGSPSTAAFGYDGAHMNWGINITGGNGGTGTISAADSFANYGIYADLDTAKGAWAATNTGGAQAGWRHDLDVGLFKSDTSGTVTLTAQGILNPNAQFGFTVFHGMDHTTGYMHHVSWNANNNTTGITDLSNPYIGGTNPLNNGTNSGTGLTTAEIVAASVGVLSTTDPFTGTTNMNTITFNAVAGEYYTIFLGGYMGGAWQTTTDGYSLTVSQVPVPGAVWLFGSAMAGLIGFGGRRKAAVAV